MKLLRRFFVILALAFIPLPAAAQETSTSGRERLLMDFNWRFAFGHPYDAQKDFGTGTGYFSYFAKAGYGDGAAAASFDDRAWRQLDLPHDWAVEQPFSAKGSFSHGFKAAGRNFPERSVGWYRKAFSIPRSDWGRHICIAFDGVFRNSIVWVNGHYLGREESGYSSFQYDITDYLNYGGSNIVAVRVDATSEEGWFYEGAGIYRHVWLTKTAPLHVAPDGTFITTQVRTSNAVVTARTEVVNEGAEAKMAEVIQTIADAQGKTVAAVKAKGVVIRPFETKEVTTDLSVSGAKLWNIETPYLYKLITQVVANGKVTDTYETAFGVRTIRFSAKEGFFLNGKPLKLRGTNNHQDAAGVGTAMPDGLQDFRVGALKAMGANACRCSHNPPTPGLLDACDRLGMLVLDENRLMGTTAERLHEVKRLITRDRNHPSVIAWSIGNEEWGIENSITGERITTTMQAFVKSLDTTRPATVAISGGFRSGISSVAEVMGYNYMGNGDIEAHHRNFPDQPSIGTEEGSTYATRGEYVTDDAKHYRSAYDQKPRPTFYSIEEGWKFYAARPYLAGMFIWTGFDYRGEPTPYGWPSVTSYFGMMDLCGFPKDNVFYLKSWWTDTPTLHLLPHWNWPGQEGKEISVWAYSNCDEVELLLNKKSLGKKKMERYGHLEWKVAYAPGTLEAIGYKGGKKWLTDLVKTAGAAKVLQLKPNKILLSADGEDISVITISVLDKDQLAVPVADNEVTFGIQGPAKIIGVGNGDPVSLENEKFTGSIQTISIDNLKEKEVGSLDDTALVALNVDETDWKEAFEKREDHNLGKAYVYRGSFTLPDDFTAADITFFYRSIGKEQSIFVNGNRIGKPVPQNAAGDDFTLDKSFLKPGRNSISIIATPIPKRYEWDHVNQDPGLFQVYTKAKPWKRKLFNGLAQVIIQTTKKAGEITLTATSGNLKPALLKISSNAVKSRLALP